MSDVGTFALSKEWKERLGLANRSSTEFYESAEAVTDTPHAGAIRSALENLGLSAIFSVQGVLTIAILSVDQYDRNKVIDLHGALWNQGLASVLLVVCNSDIGIALMYHEACLQESFA